MMRKNTDYKHNLQIQKILQAEMRGNVILFVDVVVEGGGAKKSICVMRASGVAF